MRIEHIASLAYDRLVGRLVRRAAFIVASTLCALVAIYQFTVAGSLVVQAHYGSIEAHLFVGAAYTLLGLIGAVAGNGLVLPVASLMVALALLLPLAVAMSAADALAGESAAGTLRGLLVAPVGRLRLVVMKAFGVLVVAVLATLVIAVLGVLAGLMIVGGADGQMVTLSGSAVGFGDAMGRVALAAAWTVGQLVAVGAIALAVSSLTEHPLVVLASVLGGVIVFGVLAAIPALSWLRPYLLTTGWSAGADVLRDPLPFDDLVESSLRALCYVAIGGGVTVARMLRRDA